MSVADKYQILSEVEHILVKPGMYIGSPQLINEPMHIVEGDFIVKKTIDHIPGLQRLYEEIILNAFDQTARSGTGCNEIRVNVSADENVISVWNNGQGLPVVFKDETNCYIPEMVFGMLRSGSNYDETEERVVSGLNGLGAKLVNIFSLSFNLETADSDTKKIYQQSWRDHMSEKDKPTIKSLGRKKPYTIITYSPDLAYFKIPRLSDDMVALMKKRLIDIGFASNSKVKTFFNDEELTIKRTEDYMKLYASITDHSDSFIVDASCERWTVGLSISTNGFMHASFVNGIHTSLGGSHVDHVFNVISKEVIEKLKSKKIEVKPSQIKDKLCLFIKCAIVNPIFDSQTKECLKMAKSKFGSEYVIADAFKKKLLSSNLIKILSNVADNNIMKDLSKTNGVKTARLIGIKGLEDANWAGTAKSQQTKLILTEGLSAKTFAMSAITVIGRDRFGIFPLKGKPLNVRDITLKKVMDNVEICSIVKILGLKYGTKYTDTMQLRYGGVISLTDADSVSGDTPLLLKDNETGMILHKTIEDLTDTYLPNLNGKEYGSNDRYLIWTESGWTRIKHIMRHKVTKKMFRVLTHTGCVDVTEDHSLLNPDGTEIAPVDCQIGQDLLHSFPKFNDSKTEFDPLTLNQFTVNELKKFVRSCGIQYKSLATKSNLIQSLQEYANRPEHTIPDEGEWIIQNTKENPECITHITNDEAWVMGFFMADGSCGIYSWQYTKKPKNRPNTYTFNRTNYSWHLDNCDKSLLDRSHVILTEIYGDVFNLVKLGRKGGYNANSTKPMYRLILNGGKKTKYIIDKYRELLYYKKSKYFHAILLNAPFATREQLFNGFYEGDGRHNKNEPMSFDCDGKITTQALYTLCSSLGLKVSINHDIKKPKVYTCHITAANGFLQKSKTIIKKIIELPTTADMYVYDLETENHHFQAGVGEMIVHNTDGNHICGLIMNVFHVFWPELLAMNYLGFCSTPIVKVSKNNKVLESFYTLNDYEAWIEANSHKHFTTKYFKGLGTSTAAEAREALSDIDNKIISFDADQLTNETMNLAFNKKQAEDRKLWLMERYSPKDNIDRKNRLCPVSDYINKELIHFSYYDNQRSIPNIMDGLKPSQRKILHTAIKYLSNGEMKVAQFGAKVAEKTDYHHGEASLMGAIIGMAQNYMGSNNINLLEPIGAFGSRLSNGKDAASPRYIFTALSKIAKCIFDSKDAPLLNYLNNDGILIEPEWFAPVIPMVLVNGALGIGSGFSTTVLKYNPEQICMYLLQKMRGEKPVKNLTPWYRGFNGSIEKLQPGKYVSHGVFEFNDVKRAVVIKELPIGVSTDDYKDTIEEMLADKGNEYVSDIHYGNSDTIVHMDIIINNKKYAEVRDMDSDAIRNMFKLSSKLSSTNMFLFNHKGIMTKYNNIYEIINEFFKIRMEMYDNRRNAIIDQLKYELMILANKVRFIKDVKSNKVKLATISDTSLLAFLVDNDYDQDRGINGSPLEEPTLKEFAYMIDMPIRTITLENAKKLQAKHDEKQAELDLMLDTTAVDMWEQDINDVIRANKEQNDSLIIANSMDKPKVVSKKKATKPRATKK